MRSKVKNHVRLRRRDQLDEIRRSDVDALQSELTGRPADCESIAEVCVTTRAEVVDADHLVTATEKPVDQIRSNEARGPRHD